jgi:hypothetical protein
MTDVSISKLDRAMNQYSLGLLSSRALRSRCYRICGRQAFKVVYKLLLREVYDRVPQPQVGPVENYSSSSKKKKKETAYQRKVRWKEKKKEKIEIKEREVKEPPVPVVDELPASNDFEDQIEESYDFSFVAPYAHTDDREYAHCQGAFRFAICLDSCPAQAWPLLFNRFVIGFSRRDNNPLVNYCLAFRWIQGKLLQFMLQNPYDRELFNSFMNVDFDVRIFIESIEATVEVNYYIVALLLDLDRNGWVEILLSTLPSLPRVLIRILYEFL